MKASLERSSFSVMGTMGALAITAAPSELAAARLALVAAWNELRACERILSRFDSSSQLSELNRADGAWLQVDERLFDALETAIRLRKETGGLFDPTILPALMAQGYDRSFELLEARAPYAHNWVPGAAIELDPVEHRARIERGAAIDLGGIGKGFAAGRALDAMRKAWPKMPGALVDLGGDIAVIGTPPDTGPWLIAVESVWSPATSLGTVRLTSGGIATSGPARRRFGPAGEHHHLIDPATGESAERGPLTVTVIAQDPSEADAHATALAISPDAEDYISARPGLGALVVGGLEPPRVLGVVDFMPRPVSFEVTL